MKRLCLLLILCVGLFGTASAQQDDTEIFVFPGGTFFEYPAGWELGYLDGYVTLTQGNTVIAVLDDRFLAEVYLLPADTSLTSLMQTDFEEVYGDSGYVMDMTKLEEIALRETPILRYSFQEGATPAYLYGVTFPQDAELGETGASDFGLVYHYGGVTPESEDALNLILSTFDDIPLSEWAATLADFSPLSRETRLASGAVFNHPEDAEAFPLDAATGALIFPGADVYLFDLSGSTLRPASLQPKDILEAAWNLSATAETPEFDPELLLTFDLNGRPAARYDGPAGEWGMVSLIVVPFSDGGAGVVVAYRRDPSFDELTLLAIADTFRR